jgi:hypothetical protein
MTIYQNAFLTFYLYVCLLHKNLVYSLVQQSLRISSAMTIYQKYLSPSLYIFLTHQLCTIVAQTERLKLGTMTIDQSNFF